MKLFLLFSSAAVAMFFTTSHGHLHMPKSCRLHLMPLRCGPTAASNPATVKDVKRVVDAAYRTRLDTAVSNVYATIARAEKTPKGSREWRLVIREGLPGLASRVAERSLAADARVAAVEPETPAGRRFRAVFRHALRAQAVAYDAFARDLAASRSTVTAFDRWSTRIRAMHAWFFAHIRSVVAAAPEGEREALARALSTP
jgi:hypothetical protein